MTVQKISELMEGPNSSLYKTFQKAARKDTPLDKLLSVLNESRAEVKLKPMTYARLQSMLAKIGKSKKNWDRNIWIASVLDRKNASAYFWWFIKRS
jgi:hypothetical protein